MKNLLFLATILVISFGSNTASFAQVENPKDEVDELAKLLKKDATSKISAMDSTLNDVVNQQNEEKRFSRVEGDLKKTKTDAELERNTLKNSLKSKVEAVEAVQKEIKELIVNAADESTKSQFNAVFAAHIEKLKTLTDNATPNQYISNGFGTTEEDRLRALHDETEMVERENRDLRKRIEFANTLIGASGVYYALKTEANTMKAAYDKKESELINKGLQVEEKKKPKKTNPDG